MSRWIEVDAYPCKKCTFMHLCSLRLSEKCAAFDEWRNGKDIEVVKHGRWTDNKGTRCAYEHSCSQCGFGINDFDCDFVKTPYYCPNCGAKMDEVQDAEV